MGIFDSPDFMSFMDTMMKDGAEIGGDFYYNYDEEHRRKMKEIINKDQRSYYKVQFRCGINPFEDSYSGPDNDIRIVNIDHFAIKSSLKDKLEEFKKIVYDAIDAEYALTCEGRAPTPEDEEIEARFVEAEYNAW